MTMKFPPRTPANVLWHDVNELKSVAHQWAERINVVVPQIQARQMLQQMGIHIHNRTLNAQHRFAPNTERAW